MAAGGHCAKTLSCWLVALALLSCVCSDNAEDAPIAKARRAPKWTHDGDYKAQMLHSLQQELRELNATQQHVESVKPIFSPVYLKDFHERAKKAGVRNQKEMNQFLVADGLNSPRVRQHLHHHFTHKMSLVQHHSLLTAHIQSKKHKLPIKWGSTVQELRACARGGGHICGARMDIKLSFDRFIQPPNETRKMRVPPVLKTKPKEKVLPKNTSLWEYLIEKHVPQSWLHQEAVLKKLSDTDDALNSTELQILADLTQQNSQKQKENSRKRTRLGEADGLRGSPLPEEHICKTKLLLLGKSGKGAFAYSSAHDKNTPRNTKSDQFKNMFAKILKRPPVAKESKKRLGEAKGMWNPKEKEVDDEVERPPGGNDKHGEPKFEKPQCSPFPVVGGECYKQCPQGKSCDKTSRKMAPDIARRRRTNGQIVGVKVLTGNVPHSDTITLDKDLVNKQFLAARKETKSCVKKADMQVGQAIYDAMDECEQIDALSFEVTGGPERGITALASDKSSRPPELIIEIQRNRRRRVCPSKMKHRTDFLDAKHDAVPQQTPAMQKCLNKVLTEHAYFKKTQYANTIAALKHGKSAKPGVGDNPPAPPEIVTEAGCPCIFPFQADGKKYNRCQPKDGKRDGKLFCAVAPTRYGKPCGKSLAKIQPTGFWNYCKSQQTDENGVVVSLEDLQSRASTKPKPPGQVSLLQIQEEATSSLTSGIGLSTKQRQACNLVCPANSHNISSLISQARVRLTDTKVTTNVMSEDKTLYKDKANQEKKEHRQKRAVRDKTESLRAQLVSVQRLARYSKKRMELSTDKNMYNAKYKALAASEFKEGYSKATAKDGSKYKKAAMEIKAKGTEVNHKDNVQRKKEMNTLERKEKEKVLKHKELAKKKRISNKKLQKKNAELKVMQMSVNSVGDKLVMMNAKEGKQKGLAPAQLQRYFALRKREKHGKKSAQHTVFLQKKEKKLKATLSAIEYKKKHNYELPWKQMGLIKAKLKKLMLLKLNAKRSKEYKALSRQLKDLQKNALFKFQISGKTFSEWEHKKEAYSKKESRFKREGIEKTAWKERGRKEMIEKESVSDATKEKVFKAHISHNKVVTAWNARVDDHNTRVDLCLKRRDKNVDVLVIRAGDSAFVAAERPHTAVSSLPQNMDVVGRLNVQKDWQNAFLKFPLFHRGEVREEQSRDRLGESETLNNMTNPTGSNKTGSNKTGSLNTIPLSMFMPKKAITADLMAKDYSKWAALARQNDANGKDWYEGWPGTWWNGMSHARAIAKMANARHAQRALVDKTGASKIGTLKLELAGKDASGLKKDARRRTYVVPKWYAKQIISRRRQFNPFKVLPPAPPPTFGDQGVAKVMSAGIRVYKLADAQRSDVEVKISGCTWKRNTITWSSSRSLTYVPEDKFGYLKRMMARENRIKLTIRKHYPADAEIQPPPPPPPPPAPAPKDSAEKDAEDKEDPNENSHQEKQKKGGDDDDDAVPAEKNEDGDDKKADKEDGGGDKEEDGGGDKEDGGDDEGGDDEGGDDKALGDTATGKAVAPSKDVLTLLEDRVGSSTHGITHPPTSKHRKRNLRESLKSRTKAKGLFDGTGYTGSPGNAAAMKPIPAFEYKDVYTNQFVPTESTYPKAIRPSPFAGPGNVYAKNADETGITQNLRPSRLCYCVQEFCKAAPKPGCRAVSYWDDTELAGQRCNMRVIEYVEEKAKQTEGEICGEWVDIGGDVHMVYIGGGPHFRLKIHLPGNPQGVWRQFAVPNVALQGACNSKMRIMAMAVKYGGNDFKRELRFQAKKALHDIKLQKYKLYLKSHEYIRSENEKEVNAKVAATDQQWKTTLEKRDKSWKETMQYKYLSWRILSVLYCLLPAAIPIFIPPLKFLKVPLGPMIRKENDDCCWIWPLNGDCPVCLLYGPNPVDLIIEAIMLILYLMGPPIDPNCASEEAMEASGCKAMEKKKSIMSAVMGAASKMTFGLIPPPGDGDEDEDEDEEDGDDSEHADEDSDDDSDGGDEDSEEKSDEDDAPKNGEDTDSEGTEPKSGGGGEEEKGDGDEGGDDDDDGGDDAQKQGKIRLGESMMQGAKVMAHMAVSGLSNKRPEHIIRRRPQAQYTRQRLREAAATKYRPHKHDLIQKVVRVQGNTSAPLLSGNANLHAVILQRNRRKNRKRSKGKHSPQNTKESQVKQWQKLSPKQQKQKMANERAQKLKLNKNPENAYKVRISKWENLSPERRIAVMEKEDAHKKQWKSKTPAQRKKLIQERRAKKLKKLTPQQRKRVKTRREKRAKTNANFSPVYSPKKYYWDQTNRNLPEKLFGPKQRDKLFAGTRRHYTNPFIENYGPLPAGWQSGKTEEGITYYWSDSGAKQFILPATPYLARVKKAKVTPEQLKWAMGRVLALNGWDKEWGARGDPPADVLKAVQPMKE